jgi:glycosyltransferase involved in cell wall biosynthesis
MSSVDAVVPCYNYARFLRRCVNSILTQPGVDVRVLILDDTSTDDTPEVGRALAAADPRVMYRRHATNQGHISTYNEGLLGWATAKYSLLISADDALATGALLRATALMDQHPEVGMTYGIAAIILEEDDPSPEQERVTAETRILDGAQFLQRCIETGNVVPTPSAVVRTSLQQQLGGYDPQLPHSGDLEMWMRFAANGSIGVVNAVQAYYRRHSSSMSKQYYRQPISDRSEVLQACDSVLDRWGTKFPQAPAWRDTLRKRLAENAFWGASEAFDDGEMDRYEACLDFAVELDPAIRGSAAWRRLQFKRLLGPKLWSYVGPPLLRLRDARSPSSTPTVPLEPVRPRTETGWWPG